MVEASNSGLCLSCTDTSGAYLLLEHALYTDGNPSKADRVICDCNRSTRNPGQVLCNRGSGDWDANFP